MLPSFATATAAGYLAAVTTFTTALGLTTAAAKLWRMSENVGVGCFPKQ